MTNVALAWPMSRTRTYMGPTCRINAAIPASNSTVSPPRMIGRDRRESPSAPPSSSSAAALSEASMTIVSSCGFSRTAAWTDGSAGLQTCGSSAAAKSASEPASSAPFATGSTNRSPMNDGSAGRRIGVLDATPPRYATPVRGIPGWRPTGYAARMGKLIYSMSVSLDGFAAGPTGSLDWVRVDEELHDAFDDEAEGIGAFLYGRRMYELMTAYWPTAEDDPEATPAMRRFARIWRDTSKVVFSTTLERAEWDFRLVRDGAVDEVARLKAVPGLDLGVAGPTLAATFLRAGLVDEVRLYVQPVILGRGCRSSRRWTPRSTCGCSRRGPSAAGSPTCDTRSSQARSEGCRPGRPVRPCRDPGASSQPRIHRTGHRSRRSHRHRAASFVS